MKGFGLYLIILLTLLVAVTYVLAADVNQPLKYSDVYRMVENREVSSIVYDGSMLYLETTDGQNLSYKMPYFSLFLDQTRETLKEQMDEGTLTFDVKSQPWWTMFIPYLVLIVILGLIWYFMMNKQGGGGGSQPQKQGQRAEKGENSFFHGNASK